jgi:hypothetical protein
LDALATTSLAMSMTFRPRFRAAVRSCSKACRGLMRVLELADRGPELAGLAGQGLGRRLADRGQAVRPALLGRQQVGQDHG